MARVLTSQGEDFPRWYQDVVAKAELAEAGPVRGTQVIRPTGDAIWERMQAEVDARIKAAGAQNCSFKLAVVTHGGGKQLTEPVVIRPTSETIIGEYMAKWVSSYRDPPAVAKPVGQRRALGDAYPLFLRSSEFLWQEGHTAHATEADARAYARRILHETYEDFMGNVLAIPVVTGLKTTRERFAGATRTYSLEAMMRDLKALQMGTSHELGQNFARASSVQMSSPERASSTGTRLALPRVTADTGAVLTSLAPGGGWVHPTALPPRARRAPVCRWRDVPVDIVVQPPSVGVRCAPPQPGWVTAVNAAKGLNDPVAQDLLSSSIPARLAYTWRDGTPRVVPIWFHWDGTEIVLVTPPKAPKLKALDDGTAVALTIDSNDWPYKVLSIRGRARVSKVVGVCTEYAKAAERYFGQDQGERWVSQFPPDVELWRIAVLPEQVHIIDFETRFPSALSS